MEGRLLNKNFMALKMIDRFISFIWTDRYSRCGDFDLRIPASKENLETFIRDSYIDLIPDIGNEEHVMIIEDIELTTDLDEGDILIITGRSLESILDRRIIWTQTHLNSTIEVGIKKLLDENIINPEDVSRRIPNFVFRNSNDPRIEAIHINAQFTGDNLYDAICSLCDSYGLGFKIELINGNFVFSLYMGKDRSYDQTSNPYVAFGPENDNIINTRFIETGRALKTITLVLGEGEGANRKRATCEAEGGGKTGLDRKELYTDARDISMTTIEGEEIPEEDYIKQLQQRGKEKLTEYQYEKAFEGEVDTTRMYLYGRDYFMGDITQIENEYGFDDRVRVVEYIMSKSKEGYSAYPSFEIVENNEEGG